MRIFPAVHYSMGGLWADYERTLDGGLQIGAPRNHVTNIPCLYAIGECDYQYHGGNRLGANSLLSCIFSGLVVAPSILSLFRDTHHKPASEEDAAIFERAQKQHEQAYQQLLNRPAGGENPYALHQELGEVMTRSATVVRRNDQLAEAYDTVSELQERVANCSLSDTGNWTNQNAVFARSLGDMFPIAKTILKGALMRDECRGAHYKPEFAMPSLTEEDPQRRRAEAEAWCDRFEANNEKWLKSTIATHEDGDPAITYEDVDTSVIAPRPRLYGLAGAELIDQVWKERQRARETAPVPAQIASLE
jgi:succinate dehydrogenase / fumarate reductase flavoprotein subunit